MIEITILFVRLPFYVEDFETVEAAIIVALLLFTIPTMMLVKKGRSRVSQFAGKERPQTTRHRRPRAEEAPRNKTTFQTENVGFGHVSFLFFYGSDRSDSREGGHFIYRSQLGLHPAGAGGRAICRHSLVQSLPIVTRHCSTSSLDDNPSMQERLLDEVKKLK